MSMIRLLQVQIQAMYIKTMYNTFGIQCICL